MKAPASTTISYYLPALDGLRFFAFLAVLIHHLPVVPGAPAWIRTVSQFGWSGVELFFVISSFLLFHLLRAEHQATGTISVSDFYLRRVLRIYPLMLAVPLIALAVMGTPWSTFWPRYLVLALGGDNLLVAAGGHYSKLPLGAHLWTLSFELQVYLVMPFAFLAYVRLGPQRFLAAMAGVWLAALAARSAVIAYGAAHPMIWVLPVLRPESILIGIALAVLYLKPSPITVGGVLVFALADLVSGTNVQHPSSRLIAIYPVVALAGGCLVWLALNWRPMAVVLSSWPLRKLGHISYGLYVYHLLAMYCGGHLMARLGWTGYWTTAALVLAFCIAMSVTSYFLLERPFLRLKDRFSAVLGRPS